MHELTTVRGLLLVLSVAGCPTRTIYYDAGSDGNTSGQTGSPGTGSGGGGRAGLAGAGASGNAGSGGGGEAGQRGITAAGGASIDGAAGGNSVAGATGGFDGIGGMAGQQGIAGTGGTGPNSCSDTITDAKNCGQCGHDCLGGTCSASQCQPVLLAQLTGNPNNLSVAPQFVYVTTDIGYIARVNKDGSDLKPFAMPSFTSTALEGTPVAEDGDLAFFVWTGSPIRLVSCAISSCDSTITPFGGPYSQYFALDSADHKLAWIDYSPSQLWAGPATAPTTASPIPGGTLVAGSTGSRLLYAKAGLYFSVDQSIQRLPLSGGSQTAVGYTATNSSTSLIPLATNRDTLFFTDGSTIFSTPLPNGNGGPGTKLIDADVGLYTGSLFVVDDKSAYWSATGIHTCQLTNCTSTQEVVPGTASANESQVGIDGASIYWTERATVPGQNISGFTLWKLAK